MLEKPDAGDLLATARSLLLHALLPALPEALQFQARMIANAMGIAERASEAAAAPEIAPGLAAGIRAGLHDPGSATHAATAQALRALTRARCAVSAPRSLQAPQG
ncbi:hypothetical protein C8P66_10886 [Humitalea rosea]|uniref:Uncharacterized protein n=1 Tax=Humitalea rosea TaxID=990373 RepID=A0A2W7ILC7_9PROT|nr:DUF6285 domain-containing protein [Humitalea rosea]PZW46807.1 hypothetical protein C8P66_10886 [Humitalea rosea]